MCLLFRRNKKSFFGNNFFLKGIGRLNSEVENDDIQQIWNNEGLKGEETEKKPREEISLKLFPHSVSGHRRGLYFPLNVEESNQGAFDIVQRTDLNIRYTGDGGTSMWQLGTFPDLHCTRPFYITKKHRILVKMIG